MPWNHRPFVLRITATKTPMMTWTTTLLNAQNRLNSTSRTNSKLGIWSFDVAIRM